MNWGARASGTTGIEAPTIGALSELESVVRARPSCYVRYGKQTDLEEDHRSIDTESGLELPGLSVNPLRPEEWWTRPWADWLARQVCQYKELRAKNPDRAAWILDGRVVARGPDNEPLLVDATVLGRLSETLLAEASERYGRCFDAGKGPED